MSPNAICFCLWYLNKIEITKKNNFDAHQKTEPFFSMAKKEIFKKSAWAQWAADSEKQDL